MVDLSIINWGNVEAASQDFFNAKPFRHFAVSDFFDQAAALDLESEFPPYDSTAWYCYKSKLEDKKTINTWNFFPPLTYSVFSLLNSGSFISKLSEILKLDLLPDPGLHGGGWHIHANGGRLNPHLDYSIHPKSRLERKINLIIYLSNSMNRDEMGGHLGLWEHDNIRGRPGSLVKEIAPKFNSAVFFDTTENSWHGLSRVVSAPPGVYRKSLAIYYMQERTSIAPDRPRALFAPSSDQIADPEIEALIRQRARPSA